MKSTPSLSSNSTCLHAFITAPLLPTPHVASPLILKTIHPWTTTTTTTRRRYLRSDKHHTSTVIVASVQRPGSIPLIQAQAQAQAQNQQPPPQQQQQQTLSSTFTQLYANQIPPWLLDRLSTLGFESPTHIQHEVLRPALPQTSVLPGQDVVIHAQTGSGKTLAYLLPAISAINPHRSSIQALVVVPTQELGMQVYKLLRRLTSAYTGQHHHLDNSNSNSENIDLDQKSSNPKLNINLDLEFDDDSDCDDDDDDDDDDDNDDVDDDEDDGDGDYDGIDINENLKVRSASLPVLPMLNQANLRRQKLQLRHSAPRIIVGNPHRVAELVKSGRLRLDLLKVLVVDEFDACLGDTSTTAALQTILSVRNRERDRQTILASATVPQHRHFLKQCVRQHWTRPNIRHIWLDENSGIRVPLSLKHAYALCDTRKKIAALRTLITKYHNNENASFYAIVFVMNLRNIDAIIQSLNQALENTFDTSNSDHLPVVGIHNDLSITSRKSAVRQFREGHARILIGTDLAARGLDFAHVSHIFHFDLPTNADAYLHRAGRAGRLGRDGTSVVMITRGEEFVITRMGNKLGIDFDRVGK